MLAFFSPDSISPRYRRKLKSTNFSTPNSYNYRRSRSRWNLVETMLKTRAEHRYRYHQEIYPKDDSILKSSSSDNNRITAMPRPILIILLWKFNPVFEPHVQRYWPAALFVCFLESFDRFFYFFTIWIGHTSFEKRAAASELIRAWNTPCQKFKSEFKKLMGAWPIWRLNIIFAGPARNASL